MLEFIPRGVHVIFVENKIAFEKTPASVFKLEASFLTRTRMIRSEELALTFIIQYLQDVKKINTHD
jgi:hypothetical protein